MADQEIELKLRLKPSEVGRLRRDPLIHRAKQGRATAKSLVAVYFDTPSLVLRSHKTALRLRQEGRDRIQTLKCSLGGAGLQRRLEYNAPTSAQFPDLSLIDDPEMRARLEDWIASSNLEPIFTTDIKRTIWVLGLPGARVEMALDLGRIESGSQSVPVCEVELELLDGAPDALLSFAEALSERFDCHVFEDSKAARGYGLFRPEVPVARRARGLNLDPEASAWSSLCQIMEEGTDQLFGNEAAVLDGQDPEAVHQARVAVRRMRAALSAYRPLLHSESVTPVNKLLRRHQIALGPARDWDVFILETLQPLAASISREKPFARFMERAKAAQRLSYRTAHKAIRSKKYGRLQMALTRFPYQSPPQAALDISTRSFAADLLQARYEVILNAAGEAPDRLDEPALHAFRIDIKNLRYAIDFFSSIYDAKKIKSWRSSCKKLQDCLGGLNDAVVHAGLVEQMQAPDRPVPKSVRQAIADWNARKIEKELGALQNRWKAFRALTPFWR